MKLCLDTVDLSVDLGGPIFTDHYEEFQFTRVMLLRDVTLSNMTSHWEPADVTAHYTSQWFPNDGRRHRHKEQISIEIIMHMALLRVRDAVADLGGAGGGAAAPPPSEGSRRPHPFVYDAQGCKFEGKVAEASAEGT